MVRIRLFDDRERALVLKDNASPKAHQVCEMIASKLDISAAALPCFSLWIVGQDLELQLRPKMELLDMVAKWPRYLEKYTHNMAVQANKPEAATYKFVFKREAMLLKSVEAALKGMHEYDDAYGFRCLINGVLWIIHTNEYAHDDADHVAIKLLYGEARNNVMSGRYPLRNVEEAVTMASLQAQVTADYDPTKHGPGTKYIPQSLSALVPRHMVNALRNASEWEQRICASWAEMKAVHGTGGSGEPAYMRYLALARKWECYGATYYPACKSVPPSGYFELRNEHLWIAVNAEGVCIIDGGIYLRHFIQVHSRIMYVPT
jgi:hypothetical protein